MNTIKHGNIPPILRAGKLADHLMEICEKANVPQVVAANQYGMVFLLADGGKNNGGIVYRDDRKTYEEMKSLAMEVNALLRASAWANAPKSEKNQIPVDNQFNF